ncbi:E3 ubiquitin-protein ligase RNF14-like [Syngnathus acus]|uniref:E3 ubiquitin-protein ligase RNF14-like n=1 Tax=Syngnathus acus TaxID=161584 RepID=UPI001885ADDD|nr:E3 ubiquitin-protein ligase RNF14-like [Syngnathus acus]
MDLEEQENELLALQSIFSSEEFTRHESKALGELRVSVELPSGYVVALAQGNSVKQYKVSFLPPLLLTFGLTEDYPSCSPPSFTLSCKWLTHEQLAALGAHLTDLYRATAGNVVLFSWVQFLREDTLTFLNVSSVLELPNEHSAPYKSKGSRDAALSEHKRNETTLPSGYENVQTHHLSGFLADDRTNGCDEDSRGAADSSTADQSHSISHLVTCGDVETPVNVAGDTLAAFSTLAFSPAQILLSEILIHDAAQAQNVFARTVHDCAVCFVSYLGSECIKIEECGHVFCRACLAQFCRLQITEGNVLGVTCAQAGCTASPTPAQVASLVGEEQFRRYDRLLLQSSLDRMADVTYCPRPSCASPIIVEEASSAALCSVCAFAFCVSCKKTYHGTQGCTPAGLPRRLQSKDTEDSGATLPHSLEGMKFLWDDYVSGSKQRRRLLVSRYGRKVLFLNLESSLSEGWIHLNTKNCPSCFSKIEKDAGCNVMTCSQCRRKFCWICLAVLSFSSTQQHFENGACSHH